MIKNILIILTFVSCLFASNELKWVDEQIAAIKPMRDGMDVEILNTLKDPFIFFNKENHYRKHRYTKVYRVKKVKRVSKRDRKYKKVTKKVHYHKVYRRKIVNVSLNVHLSAIMNHSFLVSGKWYKKGDILKGFRVTKIENGKVFLEKDNKRAVLSMSKTNKLNFNKK